MVLYFFLLEILAAILSHFLLQVGQPELIALEEAVKGAMTPAGTAREVTPYAYFHFNQAVLFTYFLGLYENLVPFSEQVDFGREVPLFEVEATAVEPEFEKLYSYLFDLENGGFPVEETDRPRPTAIFVVNFDKVNYTILTCLAMSKPRI